MSYTEQRETHDTYLLVCLVFQTIEHFFKHSVIKWKCKHIR